MLVFFDVLTGIQEINATPKPERFTLSAYPNPFNSQVKLSLSSSLAKGGQLDIYDVTGRLIRRLPISPNSSELLWNGQNDNGQTVATGVYFAKVISGENQQSIKLILLK
jgi:flagellar hook assembly protein FlgD